MCIDKESSYLHGDDMDNGNQHGNPARFLIFILTVFLTITAFVAVQPFQASGGAPATVATYSHGLLHLTIAYHAARSGAGQLTIEVLDPEDNVLGRAERQVEVAAGQGRWQDQIKLEKPLPLDDLVWHRVRYRFEYADRQTAAIGGHGVHLADPAHAGDSHPGTAVLPDAAARRQCA